MQMITIDDITNPVSIVFPILVSLNTNDGIIDIEGGFANTTSFIEEINGGEADTTEQEIIYGGNAQNIPMVLLSLTNSTTYERTNFYLYPTYTGKFNLQVQVSFPDGFDNGQYYSKLIDLGTDVVLNKDIVQIGSLKPTYKIYRRR